MNYTYINVISAARRHIDNELAIHPAYTPELLRILRSCVAEGEAAPIELRQMLDLINELQQLSPPHHPTHAP